MEILLTIKRNFYPKDNFVYNIYIREIDKSEIFFV